ncbi:membrane protein [Nocardioides baekrokdamisoli]|uniref:Membrane protein n=1 Tax=Nocardioides baekrokdamisoli TaxID=1804624 RepID=A0A3G9IY88_9ACTN|nr:MMPL family transporter [Nocardioides baekrokdamisoli]BBH16268.1 membrane protein [Nocardioides baekrokdamisoli]
MLNRIANLAIRAPRRVLVAAVLFLIGAGVLGAPVAHYLKSGGFTVDSSQSNQATIELDKKFNGAAPNLIIQISTNGNQQTDPASRTAAAAASAQVEAILKSHEKATASGDDTHYVGAIRSVSNVPPSARAALVAKDHTATLVLGNISGDDSIMQTRAGDLGKELADKVKVPGATITVGGSATGYHQVNDQTVKDLLVAEAISIPLTGIALVLVFGSAIAALLPLLIGGFAIIGTLAELRILTWFTDVSVYAQNMTTALGLALAIDYALFIISRYREELRKGTDREQAIITTINTAGRTVLFSSLTVALSLAALAVFPMFFLKSFAYAGLVVVGLAAFASLVILPAALVLLGDKVNAYDARKGIRKLLGRPEPLPKPEESGLWFRLAHRVMKRPLAFGGAVVVLLLALGAPFLQANYGYPDDRVLPQSASARQVGDDMRTNFTLNAGASLAGIGAYDPAADPGMKNLAAYTAQLSRVANVDSVVSAAGLYRHGARVVDRQAPPVTAAQKAALVQQSDAFAKAYVNDGSARFDVVGAVDPFSKAGSQLVKDLRAVSADGISTQWTGWAAFNLDAMTGLGATLPIALALIALSTFIVLFLFTGSVVIPLKALVMNTLSLTATFGAMVWVFQWGHLSSVLGFTSAGYLVANMVVLVFCMAFGLSMDYEVFLLSRIREEWVDSDQSHDANTHAVAYGVGRTGRIVTSAAALMAIVFAAMISSKIQFMQLFGLGLTLAVLMDATLVRGILVPAFMRLMGKANWWAPKPLVALHARFGLSEAENVA